MKQKWFFAMLMLRNEKNDEKGMPVNLFRESGEIPYSGGTQDDVE